MGRPLMTACIVYLLSLAFCVLFPSSYAVAAAVIITAAAIILFISSFFKKDLKKYAVLVLISALTVFSFLIYEHLTIKPAKLLLCGKVDISATVMQTELSESKSKYYIVKLNEINSKPAPRDIKIRLYCENNDNLCDYDKIVTAVSFFSGDALSSSERYYLSNNIFGSAISIGDIKITNKDDFSLMREICKIRDNMVLNIRSSIPDERGNIISAILFGKRDYVENDTTRLFAYSGISHLLAVSGLHLSIIVALIDALLSLFAVHKSARTIISILCTAVMMIMTGFTPSIIRAAVMTTLSLIADCIRRDYDAPTALSLSAVIICFANPYAITNIGFLLSFSATFGLIVSQSILERQRIKFSMKTVSIPRLISYEILKLILPCFFAFIFTIPITACVFGYLSVYSPIVNLLLAPIIPLSLALSLSGALFSLTSLSFIYTPLFYLAKLSISCITWIAQTFSNLKFSKIYIQSDYTSFVVIVMVICFLIASLSKRKLRNNIIAALLCVPIICTAVISNHILNKDTVKISLFEADTYSVMIEHNKKCFISGFTGDSSYAIKRELDSHGGGYAEFISAENIASKDISALTHFIKNTDVNCTIIPKKHSAAISSVDSTLADSVYITDNFSAKYFGLSISSKVYGKNTVVFFDIDGFKLAYLTINSTDKLPDSFSCDLLIANSNSLVYLDSYTCNYFILSEKLEDSKYLNDSLSRRKIIYIDNALSEDIYLRGKDLFKKRNYYKLPL